ncbi:hypothetical protein HHI36_023534 [Cryptolaemus montrouzieri]|uniref:Uncharacterized protein n=1 Tax=Cryptolaemus montrouzieri TaxID=559131 RepID=A0ABD2PGP6_9CUCU
MGLFLILTSILCLASLSSAQTNAGSSVAPNLIKCYNNSAILQKDNRLPATVETLISLIRKIEDKTPYSSNRELAAQIIQSFRQDGIIKSTSGGMPSKYGIPFSPKEWNSYRNKVLLKKVLPRSPDLDTSVLTDLEQCSLHYILSKSVEYRTRGDEQNVCNQLGKYRMRQRRHLSAAEQVEQFGAESESLSACPVELGVVNTKWGAISPGSLLSGIASGFNAQQIPVNGSLLDSRFGATIVGDLAEAALYQISHIGSVAVEVGAEGNWNCTLEPKWYFVRKNQYLQLTDAEIRGGLDGLYLASSMDKIRKNYQDIKISQIIDLYYSPRGVYDNSLRACNRKVLETSFINTQKLIDQTSYFEVLLDPVATLDSSIDPQKYKELAALAVNSFNKYLPGNLNDPVCSEENTTVVRVSSDLVIFVDMGFEYRFIQPIISYLLDNIDVNRYDTKYSIVNAKTGETLVNSSTSILDFHQLFNQSVKYRMQQGVDFALTLETIESLSLWKMNNKTNSGGSSSVYLLMAQSGPSDNQNDFASQKTEEMKKKYPDTRILILGVGQKTDYKNYVINYDYDVFILPDTSSSNSIGSEAALKLKINEIIDRIKEVPRSVINPSCGADFDFKDKSTINLVQYVEPGGQNIYKISPNYFYKYGDNAVLKVRGQGYGSLTICTMRVLKNFNPSSNSPDCKTLNSDEYSHDIKGYCDGSFSDCDPIYIYVGGGNSYYRCSDAGCRFPDNIKFTISLENVECTSSAVKFASSFLVILALLFAQYYHAI